MVIDRFLNTDRFDENILYYHYRNILIHLRSFLCIIIAFFLCLTSPSSFFIVRSTNDNNIRVQFLECINHFPLVQLHFVGHLYSRKSLLSLHSFVQGTQCIGNERTYTQECS